MALPPTDALPIDEKHDERIIADQIDEEDTSMDKRILRKIDGVVLTLVTIVATLEFLDKNGMAYAAVFGMRQETGLVGQEYSWLGSIFYFGYLGALAPCLYLVNVVHTGLFVGIVTTAWGVVILCMAACHNFAGLATVRFFLGVFEAGILPAFMILQSKWWKRSEQALRTALWYNTFAGIFGGILSYAIGHIQGSLSTWRYIFIIYGAVTVLVGIIVTMMLPDRPETAWFLNAKEKVRAQARLAGNQQNAHDAKFNPKHCLEAITQPQYWIVVLFVIAQSITNAGITNFNPLIISGFGYDQQTTTLMATPQAAVALVGQVIFSFIALYVPNIRCLLWMIACLPALSGAIMINTLNPVAQRTASLVGVYLMGFYNVPWVLCLSLVTSNTSGSTKKAFASVSVATAYSVGNIIGPQFFRADQAPHYKLGLYAMMVCFAIMFLCGGAYWAIVYLENRKRDRIYGPPALDRQLHGASIGTSDTDKVNKDFRYSY